VLISNAERHVMSILSRLFGSGAGKPAPAAEPETYEGFSIYPNPAKSDGGYRLGARIEKEIDGQLRVHEMMRADIFQSLDEAEQFSVRKARQLIDQQGLSIFRD
jgi:hypothetical protein